MERNHRLEDLMMRIGLELEDRMKLINHGYGEETNLLECLIFCKVTLMSGLSIIKLLNVLLSKFKYFIGLL